MTKRKRALAARQVHVGECVMRMADLGRERSLHIRRQLQVSDLPQGTDFRLRVPERLGERLRRLVNAKGRYIDELDPPRHRELECEKGPFVVSRDAVKVGNGHPARAE